MGRSRMMLNPRALCIALFALLYLSFPHISDAQSTDTLRIISPASGAILHSNELMLVRAEYAGSPKIAGVEVSVRIKGPSDKQQIDLTRYTADAVAQPLQIVTTWDPRGSPAGIYSIEVDIQAARTRLTAATKFQLEHPPEIGLSITQVALLARKVEITFEAAASVSPGAHLEYFLWHVNEEPDPVKTEDSKFSAVFALDEPASISVVGVDSLGGRTLVTRDVFLREEELLSMRGQPDRALQAKDQNCGCTKMTIRQQIGSKSGVYCANRQQEIDTEVGCTTAPPPVDPDAPPLCPPRKVAYLCPLGEVVPSFQANPQVKALARTFEIMATLSERSDPAQCEEGQFARIQSAVDGQGAERPVSQSHPPGRILPAGAGGNPLTIRTVGRDEKVPRPRNPQDLWGRDDYDLPSIGKVHEPRKIRWIDSPGPRMSKQPRIALVEAEFVSFVAGRGGTCWCRFNLNQSFNQANTPQIGGFGIQFVDGLNCVIE